MADSMPPTNGPRHEPRVTHYAEGSDPLTWTALCGATVFTSITRSLRLAPDFTDCDRCFVARDDT